MDVTVAGFYFGDGRLVQLVGEKVTPEAIKELVSGYTVYTYNGSRFDIPVVKSRVKIDIERVTDTHDLMYDCWRNNLYGGLKKVEQKLGISRQTEGMDGHDAMRLWEAYKSGKEEALEILLEYNMEDVKNLEILREKLMVD